MILAPFEIHVPESLDEAFAIAAEHPADFDWIAGGTDMLQNYKNRLNAKGHLVALDRVVELRGIAAADGEPGGGRIGAMERLAVVGAHPAVRARWPGLAEAIDVVASPLIRNSATLGGNLLVENRCYWFNQTPFWRSTKGSCLKAESDVCRVIPQEEVCYAAYSGDLAPVLMVLGASVELASAGGTRTVALVDFYEGDGIARNVKRPDELVVAVRIPVEADGLRSGYRKLRHRDTLDYPEMGVAAAARLDRAGRVESLRVATTAVDTVPQHADYTAQVSGRLLAEVAVDVATDMESRADPHKNTAMSVGYRKKMVRVYLERLLHDLAGAQPAEERTGAPA